MDIFFINKELTVILTGALPVLEVRGALPLALFYYDFPPLKAYLLAVLGNSLPIIPVLFSLTYFSEYLMRKFYYINRFLNWLFERTRQRHGDHFESYRWMPFALFIFVAIPLPLTGAWSGMLAALIFGIKFWKATLAITLGILTAGGTVLAITQLGANAGKFL